MVEFNRIWWRIFCVQQSGQGQGCLIQSGCASVRPSARIRSFCWITGYFSSFWSVHSRRKDAKAKHLADAAPYRSRSSNLLWAAGVEAEELSLSREANLQPFQFHPAHFQSPSAWTSSRPGQRCHLLFISSVIKEAEEVLYIVMLPHLCDISKIEVQAKDQYELKVNKSKKSGSGAATVCSLPSICFSSDVKL